MVTSVLTTMSSSSFLAGDSKFRSSFWTLDIEWEMVAGTDAYITRTLILGQQ